MKKTSLILLMFFAAIFILTGCISTVQKWSNDDIKVTVEKKTTLKVFAEKNYDGLEIIIDKVIPEENIELPEGSENVYLYFYKLIDGKTVLSFAGNAGIIPKDFQLLTITGDFPDIKSLNIETQSVILPSPDLLKRDSFSGTGDIDVPYLLGDFNFDGKVDIFDFTKFVDVYLEPLKYELNCDVYPSSMDLGWGEWSNFYNVTVPDGNINIFDFTIFGKNYFLDRPDITDLRILIMQFISISRLELADNYGALLAESVDTKRKGKPIENYSKTGLVTAMNGAFATYEINEITITSYDTAGENTLSASASLTCYINAENTTDPTKPLDYNRTLYFEASKAGSVSDPWKMDYFEEQY